MFEEEAQHYKRIAETIHLLSANVNKSPSLAELADLACQSETHFQRTFVEWAGISPKQYLQNLKRKKAKSLLRTSSVLDVSEQLGYTSQSRLYDNFVRHEAVTPGEFKNFKESIEIQVGFANSPFGPMGVASTKRGIVKLSFLKNDDQIEKNSFFGELAKEWPVTSLSTNDAQANFFASQIFAGATTIDQRGMNGCSNLRLWVKGTVFQIKVWEALLRIPEGEVWSYRKLAELAGNKTGVRAVASAIAKNPIAYLIPCHRVIRGSGEINQYRWGESRKAAILIKETAR